MPRLYKHKVHDGQAYIFYMDIRSTGKGYEEFVQQGMEEEGICISGKASRIYRDGDKVVVWGVDTLSGKKVEIAADMVVLATAIIAKTIRKNWLPSWGSPPIRMVFNRSPEEAEAG